MRRVDFNCDWQSPLWIRSPSAEAVQVSTPFCRTQIEDRPEVATSQPKDSPLTRSTLMTQRLMRKDLSVFKEPQLHQLESLEALDAVSDRRQFHRIIPESGDISLPSTGRA